MRCTEIQNPVGKACCRCAVTAEKLWIKYRVTHSVVINSLDTGVVHRPQVWLSTDLIHTPKGPFGGVLAVWSGAKSLPHVDKWLTSRYNGGLFFASSGFQLRGYPCQWNFGSSAWSFCAMNCLPSNSTPGSVRYRSKPKATSCACMRPTVSFSIGSMKNTWAACSNCWASMAAASRLPFPY